MYFVFYFMYFVFYFMYFIFYIIYKIKKMAKTQKFKDPSSYTKKQLKNFSMCAKKKFDKKSLKRHKYKCDFDKYITYSGAQEK